MPIIMRIGVGIVIISCIGNLVWSPAEGTNVESEVTGDSEWWSKRITMIDGKRPIAPKNGDSSRRPSSDWAEEERRKFEIPSPGHSSTLAMPEIRYGFESQRENFRNIDDSVQTIGQQSDLSRSAPSPILLPPREFSGPVIVHRDSHSDLNDVETDRKNQSTYGEKFNVRSSAIERNRIREIAESNSSTNDVTANKRNNDDDTSSGSRVKDEKRLSYIARMTSIDATKTGKERHADEDGRDPTSSYNIYESGETTTRSGNSTTVFNRKNHRVKYSRGSRKYHHDFGSENFFARQQSVSSTAKYDWQRRSHAQRSNHFKFNSDFRDKVGAVPGVPGRDYPVHQEHTHHNLRNVAERFPCPRTPKTHVYLADRASRCQIFYVCYGSKTGVPMVCPNGTLFSEPLQVCDWWFNVSC